MKKWFKPLATWERFLFTGPMTFVIFISIIFVYSSPSQSSTVTLDLSPGAEQSIAGHKVYYGTKSKNYTYCIDLFNSTSCVISGLEDGNTYFFAATAYDSSGIESVLSNEVTKYISAESVGAGTASGEEEIIVDTENNAFSNGPIEWATSSYSPGAYSTYYHYALPGDGRQWAKWKFMLSTPGNVEVYARWTEAPNRSVDAPYTIVNNGSQVSVTVDQTTNGGQFVSLGTYWLEAGVVEVVLRDTESGYVVADAVKLVMQ